MRALILLSIIGALGMLAGPPAHAQRKDLHVYYTDLAGGAATAGMSAKMGEKMRRELDSLAKRPDAQVVFYRINGNSGMLVTDKDRLEEMYRISQDQKSSEPYGNGLRDCAKLRDYLYKLEANAYTTIQFHVYLSAPRATSIAANYSPFYHFFLEEIFTSPLAINYLVEVLYPRQESLKYALDVRPYTFLNKHPTFRNPSAEYRISTL